MQNLNIVAVPQLGELESEVVERKGIGHPDTVADALAENLSVAYSRYTLDNFGAILHHNFDKVAVLGGKTEVDFGNGKLTSPIRVILNGRASVRFADEDLPVRDLLEVETRRFFSELFKGYINPQQDLDIHWFVSNASGPGKTKWSTGSRAHLFAPRSIAEVKGYDRLLNNDTSMGCGYAPLSPLEQAVRDLETALNSPATKQAFPWLGTDIKVMATRVGQRCGFTVCLPQIARYVPSLEVYQENLAAMRSFIEQNLKAHFSESEISLWFNTRDDFARGDVYLTAIGSSIESGDEGIVGRGNRVNGLITPLRPINLEGACGKNPKYYTGKLYNVAAHRIAERLYQETQSACEVLLVSQAGQPLLEPWQTIVRLAHVNDEKRVAWIVEEELARIPDITDALLKKTIRLY
jgi:S-adenosylmethionine synthetase